MDDLHKIRPSHAGLRMEIDDPDTRRLVKPAGIIRGWFATVSAEIPEIFAFHIGAIALPHRVVPRLDVEAALPGQIVVGFDIQYELAAYLPNIDQNRLLIHLKLPGYDRVLLRFQIEESALAACLAEAGGV